MGRILRNAKQTLQQEIKAREESFPFGMIPLKQVLSLQRLPYPLIYHNMRIFLRHLLNFIKNMTFILFHDVFRIKLCEKKALLKVY